MKRKLLVRLLIKFLLVSSSMTAQCKKECPQLKLNTKNYDKAQCVKLCEQKELLKKNFDNLTEIKQYSTFDFFEAIERNNIPLVQNILHSGQVDIQAVNQHGSPALHIAVFHNHQGMLRFLCQQPGVNINQLDSNGVTALLLANLMDNPFCMNILREYGAKN